MSVRECLHFCLYTAQSLGNLVTQTIDEQLETACVLVFLFVCSPVGRMAMQFVAAQMMTAVWNGPSTSPVMKPPVSTSI